MASSARFGQVGIGGAVSVRADLRGFDFLALTNRVTMSFRGGAFQRALTKVNGEAAHSIQVGEVEQLEGAVAETGRRQRGGKRLESAIMDPRNIDVTASSFIVGRPSWLDQSPAKLYWRRIEEGDPNTFDAYILFSNSGADGGYGKVQGPYVRPSYERTNMRMRQKGRGVFVRNIGPFPKYEFSLGGQRAMRAFPFKPRYSQELKTIGLPLS